MKKFGSYIWKEWKGELLLMALLLPFFWYLMDTGYLNDTRWVSQKAGLILCMLGTAALVLVLWGGMTWERAVLFLVLCGLILRISYVLGTASYYRHHDYGDIQWFVYGHSKQIDIYDYGHAPYVLYLYLNRSLADFNVGQFYHPPLFHILAAVAMRVTYKIIKIEDLIYLFESSKLISCLASCYTLLLVPKICRELRIRRLGKCLAVGVMAFLPMFYLMANWVNNDGLAFYFMTWILLYTIRWYRSPSWSNTLFLALGFGLGMMTKMSCSLLALFTGFVMLLRLFHTVQKVRKKEQSPALLKSLFLRFAGFAAVAFPLGLSYPIRNYVKFGQPLNYVLELALPQVPVKSFVQRFLEFPVSRLFTPVFADTDEYNLNMFLLKTSSFGEFFYEGHHIDAWGAVIVAANLLLILLALTALVVVWRSTKDFLWRWAFPGLWLLQYGSLVVFAQRYPYTCSMDARYIPVAVLLGALYLGKAVQMGCTRRKQCAGEEKTGKTVGWWMVYLVLCVISLLTLAVSGGYFILHV